MERNNRDNIYDYSNSGVEIQNIINPFAKSINRRLNSESNINEQCNLSVNNLTVIGAGGFGTVYQDENDVVIKTIINPSECDDAKIEFDKHKIIYDTFTRLDKVKNVSDFVNTIDMNENDILQMEDMDEILKLVKKYVVISQPYKSCTNKININNIIYSCFFTMSKLKGIPVWMYNDIDIDIMNNVDPEYYNHIGENFELMLHLSFNTETTEGIIGREYNKPQISKTNPARGYFINADSNMLNILREKYNFDLSDYQIKCIMGFVYSYIFKVCDIIPIDIEICLGYYDGKFKINVLDFGMTIDMHKTNNIPENSSAIDYKDLLNNEYISKEIIESKVKSDISNDIFRYGRLLRIIGMEFSTLFNIIL